MPPRILIVEDEPLIGLELVDALTLSNFEVLGPATSVRQAFAILGQANCDAAALDVNLGRETAAPVAEHLRKAGVPFVVLSGYSKDQYPAAFAGAACLSKPVNVDELIVLLKKMTQTEI